MNASVMKITLLPVEGKQESSSSSNLEVHQEVKDCASDKEIVPKQKGV